MNFDLFYKDTKKCIVVGDIMLDKYIYGSVDRISPEAPVPVLSSDDSKIVLGGAANVAGNISGLNLDVILIGVIGSDEAGTDLLSLLAENNVEFSGIRSDNRRTTLKTRVIGKNQQLLRIDREDTNVINDREEEILLKNVERSLSEADYLIISDYNKGVCSFSFCKKIISLCNENNVKVIVDPKSSDWSKYSECFLITPNFKEFKDAVGCSIKNDSTEIHRYSNELINKYHIQNILVTRSQYGMTLVLQNDTEITFDSAKKEVFDVSGAGDTVIATLASALSVGYPLKESVELSNYAAGIAVSKLGTYKVTLQDLSEGNDYSVKWYEEKVLSLEELIKLVNKWRTEGNTIVFTNGCFDILHLGHIDYLNKASKLGSKFIIGVNSDDSVKRLKGSSRPVNNQDIRTRMLASLQCVDAVVVFGEDTPEKLISKICPDYLVKGGDYEIENIVGRQYAKNVTTIPFLEGFSTTELISKIKNL